MQHSAASSLGRAAVPVVLQQHFDDATVLRGTRSVLVRAPHIRLHLLARHDERLSAHLDGLAEAGEASHALCQEALANPSPGVVFVAAVLALGRQDGPALQRLLAIVQALPELERGFVSAFGWVEASSLRGLVKPLLESADPFVRRVGLAGCALHQVDPGSLLADMMDAGQDLETALTLAGRLGREDLLERCLVRLASDDAGIRHAAARAALLLGDRQASVETLASLARAPGPLQPAALCLVLQVLAAPAAHALLKPLAHDPGLARLLVRAIGMAGDPHYVPWLLKQMADPKLARIAAEAFATITGVDIAFLDLDREPPEGAVDGPDDDPANTDVALDEDESLPWPCADKLSSWWEAHASRFTPGVRHFCGVPPTPAHALAWLMTGPQRQRIAAAVSLCLLQPGTALFNVAAPAWRQERLLRKMGA